MCLIINWKILKKINQQKLLKHTKDIIMRKYHRGDGTMEFLRNHSCSELIGLERKYFYLDFNTIKGKNTRKASSVSMGTRFARNFVMPKNRRNSS